MSDNKVPGRLYEYTGAGAYYGDIAKDLTSMWKKTNGQSVLQYPVDAPKRAELYVYHQQWIEGTWIKVILTPKGNDLQVSITNDSPVGVEAIDEHPARSFILSMGMVGLYIGTIGLAAFALPFLGDDEKRFDAIKASVDSLVSKLRQAAPQ